MVLTKLKAVRMELGFTQNDMGAALNIEGNTYSLIENGVTRLVDKEQIKLLEEKLGKNALELGIFDDMSITQTFNEKVGNGYAAYIQNLNAGNNELTQTLTEELKIKNKQIENLIEQNNFLRSKL